jgi:hypothetical protein
MSEHIEPYIKLCGILTDKQLKLSYGSQKEINYFKKWLEIHQIFIDDDSIELITEIENLIWLD